MNFFEFWIIGWIIWMIAYYIFEVYIEHSKDNKKLIIYKGFTSGILSWFGIIIVITILLTYGISIINEFIEEKLSK